MESFALGAALGLFAGIVPGPFLTLVATTALRNGLDAALKVALIPLGTELPVVLVSVLVLTQLPYAALRWIGIAGGILVLYMAWRVERDAADPTLDQEEVEPVRGHYFRVALVGLLAPAPWIFWFLIAGPLFLARWNVSPWNGIVFVLSFFACFIGMMMLVAWGVNRGGRKLSQAWHRRVLRGAGLVLAVAGAFLIWQSWVGNFSEMVDPQRQIQDVVGSRSVLKKYSGARAGVFRVRDKALPCYREESMRRCHSIVDWAPTPYRAETPRRRTGVLDDQHACGGYGGTGPSPALALLDVAHGYAFATPPWI